ncbi:hypothetical protein ACFWP2_15685 [Kitasatospora sp. NPDC058444]|uniref:hypothetical protein n=1 Tax=Kitasatospora sp. NPDC058444 TaxID=3346504 RepID=UPI00365C44D9
MTDSGLLDRVDNELQETDERRTAADHAARQARLRVAILAGLTLGSAGVVVLGQGEPNTTTVSSYTI